MHIDYAEESFYIMKDMSKQMKDAYDKVSSNVEHIKAGLNNIEDVNLREVLLEIENVKKKLTEMHEATEYVAELLVEVADAYLEIWNPGSLLDKK